MRGANYGLSTGRRVTALQVSDSITMIHVFAVRVGEQSKRVLTVDKATQGLLQSDHHVLNRV